MKTSTFKGIEMTPEEAEAFLSSQEAHVVMGAVHTLAPLTPDVVYSPQPLYDIIKKTFQDAEPTDDEVSEVVRFLLITGVCVAKLPEDAASVKSTVQGHTNRDVETGDWEMSVQIGRVRMKRDPVTDEAVGVLSRMPHEELRPILSRLINATHIALVTNTDKFDGFAEGQPHFKPDTALLNGVYLGAAALTRFLPVGNSLSIPFIFSDVRSEDVFTIEVNILRLSGPKPENAETEMTV